MIEVNWNPTPRELRVFAILWLAFFSAMGFIAQHRAAGGSAMILWTTGALGGVAGLLRPASLRLLYVLWMGAAYPIGFVVSNLILGAAFYLIMTPAGLLQRLAGRDPLQRALDRKAPTYWEPRSPPASAARYFRQY